MNIPAKTSAPESDVMESVIAKGDLAKLTSDERVKYYTAVCKSLGVNPLTQPLSYITLNGKLMLYATRTCTDQLRKINNVSVEIVSRRVTDDVLTVHVKATTPDGRSDEDFGSVAYPSLLKGEARANAELKAITKAKRRATLSICGLGWLDETEVETIPGAKITESAGVEQTPVSDAADAAPASDVSPREAGAVLLLQQMAQEAAMRGEAVFKEFYKNRTEPEKAHINAIGDQLRKILDGDPRDENTSHLKLVEAFKHGQRAKADGHQRRAIPPEYREPNATREALCWQSGYDGGSMPEFTEQDHD
jgi:hypothetical protein